MMRLKPRLDALERQLSPVPARRWVRVMQQPGQSLEQAFAGYESLHGPVGDANVILRAIVQQPIWPGRELPIKRNTVASHLRDQWISD